MLSFSLLPRPFLFCFVLFSGGGGRGNGDMDWIGGIGAKAMSDRFMSASKVLGEEGGEKEKKEEKGKEGGSGGE